MSRSLPTKTIVIDMVQREVVEDFPSGTRFRVGLTWIEDVLRHQGLVRSDEVLTHIEMSAQGISCHVERRR